MTKLALLIFIGIAQLSKAQDTCHVNKTIDQFDGTTTASIPYYMFFADAGELWITAAMYSDDFVVRFLFAQTRDIICFKDGAKAVVLFRDSSKVEIYHNTSTNCKGGFYFYSRLKDGSFSTFQSEMNSMLNKTIKAIRFDSTEGYFDVELDKSTSGDENAAQHFMKALKCLQATSINH